MGENMAGENLYLRIGTGPIQLFRVWNRKLFLECTAQRCAENKDKHGKPDPLKLAAASEAEYKAQRAAK
jgi:hypothetical protein